MEGVQTLRHSTRITFLEGYFVIREIGLNRSNLKSSGLPDKNLGRMSGSGVLAEL